MFREDFPLTPNAPYTGPISGWPAFGLNRTVANITIAGFEFGPEDELISTRCAFIDELLMDEGNGV